MYYCDMEAERFLNYKEEFFMMLRFRKMMAVLLAAEQVSMRKSS